MWRPVSQTYSRWRKKLYAAVVGALGHWMRESRPVREHHDWTIQPLGAAGPDTRPGVSMAAKVIYADFKSKSWHRPESLEEMAISMTEQFNKMAEEGVVCEMSPYADHGGDGMIYESSMGYVAPDKDPA